MDWQSEIRIACAPVDGWIERIAPDRWLAPRDGAWTRKDLLGHLAAWSDLLLDEVEALRQGRPETIAAIEVDAWNAVQVERRRGWTVEATIATWRQSVRRADEVISDLPPEIRSRRWRVAWATEPVSIDDLLRLMVGHIEQHRPALTRDEQGVNDAESAPAQQRGGPGDPAW